VSEREFALVDHFFQDELALDSERPHGGLEGNLFVVCLNCGSAEEQEGCDLPLLRLHGLNTRDCDCGLALNGEVCGRLHSVLHLRKLGGIGLPHPPATTTSLRPESGSVSYTHLRAHET